MADNYNIVRVLDHGRIEVLETFGNDLTVVNAARVSYNKTATEFSPRDAKLVKFLAEHNHITPFFHPQVRLRIKMPIFVAREWFRHTVGAARNEVSRRYVDFEPECYVPDIVRARDPKLKQGSKNVGVENNDEARGRIRAANEIALGTYEILLKEGVAPEVARTVLPQGMYTEFIETGSLAFYARLCNLRLDPGAQWEIQQYAKAIRDMLKPYFPVAWEALCHDDSITETGAAPVCETGVVPS